MRRVYNNNKKNGVEEVTVPEFKAVLDTSSNWKAPVIDGIPNFLLKQLQSIHLHLATAYNNLVNEKGDISMWLTKEKTQFIQKNDITEKNRNLQAYNLPQQHVKNLNGNHCRKNT